MTDVRLPDLDLLHAVQMGEVHASDVKTWLTSAIEGQDALRARIAELEASERMSEAARSIMLADLVSQSSELTTLRARANRLSDACGQLKSENDRLTRELARLGGQR